MVLEERVEWEMGEDCSHSYSTRCFSSLTTRYTPTQVHTKFIINSFDLS